MHGRPARLRGRLWGVCGKRRLWRFGARGDGPFARALPPGSVVGHRRRSGRAARRLRCGTWTRQGRRVTTTADCLSLLGLDHTDGGPEVKRRTEGPLPKATPSRQVASGRRVLGANACDARRSAARTIGADRADGTVARLTGPDGLRPTAALISLVPPARAPTRSGGPRSGPYSHGRFESCGRSTTGRARYPPVRGTSPVIHPAESSPADSGRKLSSPVPCGRAYVGQPRAHPERPPGHASGLGARLPPRAPTEPATRNPRTPSPDGTRNPEPRTRLSRNSYPGTRLSRNPVRVTGRRQSAAPPPPVQRSRPPRAITSAYHRALSFAVRRWDAKSTCTMPNRLL